MERKCLARGPAADSQPRPIQMERRDSQHPSVITVSASPHTPRFSRRNKTLEGVARPFAPLFLSMRLSNGTARNQMGYRS